MRILKSALAAAVVSCALAGSAAAMPADHLSTQGAFPVQHAAWVCGPFRCWWRPAYWGYPGYLAAPGAYWAYPGYWRNRVANPRPGSNISSEH
jgi:hypothetical protein